MSDRNSKNWAAHAPSSADGGIFKRTTAAPSLTWTKTSSAAFLAVSPLNSNTNIQLTRQLFFCSTPPNQIASYLCMRMLIGWFYRCVQFAISRGGSWDMCCGKNIGSMVGPVRMKNIIHGNSPWEIGDHVCMFQIYHNGILWRPAFWFCGRILRNSDQNWQNWAQRSRSTKSSASRSIQLVVKSCFSPSVGRLNMRAFA